MPEKEQDTLYACFSVCHAPIHLTSSKVSGPNMLNEKYLPLPILKARRLGHIMQRACLQPFEKPPKARSSQHHKDVHIAVDKPQEVARIPGPVLHTHIQDRATFWKGHTLDNIHTTSVYSKSSNNSGRGISLISIVLEAAQSVSLLFARTHCRVKPPQLLDWSSKTCFLLPCAFCFSWTLTVANHCCTGVSFADCWASQ